ALPIYAKLRSRVSRVTRISRKPAVAKRRSRCPASARANNRCSTSRWSGRYRLSISARAPHIGTRSRNGDDTHRGTTAWAEHTGELCQAPGGIGEEHEAQLTEHGVEGGIGEWQRLTICHDWPESRSGQPGMCGVEHRQRDGGADHEPRGPTLARAH